MYAAIGYATFLGWFAPVVGVVRFWPVVVIPAVFSIAFSPFVGAAGAAIGIFISDMFVHGNPLLSLSVGVTSNFLGFYLLGLIAQQSATSIRGGLALVLQLIPFVASLYMFQIQQIPAEVVYIFAGVAFISMAATALFLVRRRDLANYVFASSVGLLVGSSIIGVGVWGFSQLFVLPSAVLGGATSLPLSIAILLFAFTYLTEIPFLVFLTPPLLYAVQRALPSVARTGRMEKVELGQQS